MDDPKLVILPEDALYQEAAERFVLSAVRAITQRGACCVALSGGSTPRALYQLLAQPEYAQRISWPGVHVFWGDERCVPATDPESNFRMVGESLLDHVPIPAENVHRIQCELDPPQAAQDYECTLRSMPEVLPLIADPLSGLQVPRFDFFLLGMGADGHTASLFAGTRALQQEGRLAVENWVGKLERWRVTLTAEVINAAAAVMFLVAGEQKAGMLKAVLEGPRLPDRLPAQRVEPWGGSLTWLVDEAAAAMLEKA